MAHHPLLAKEGLAREARADRERAPRPSPAALAAYQRLHLAHLNVLRGVAPLPPLSTPFAVVVGCADHEAVVPEGLGLDRCEVLSISGLSTVITPSTADGVAFLVESEELALVLVVGHAGCGFLAHALSGASDDPIARAVRGAVRDPEELARLDGDPLARTSRLLAESAAEQLRLHPVLARRALVCAAFEHRDGSVELLDPPPLEWVPPHLT